MRCASLNSECCFSGALFANANVKLAASRNYDAEFIKRVQEETDLIFGEVDVEKMYGISCTPRCITAVTRTKNILVMICWCPKSIGADLLRRSKAKFQAGGNEGTLC